MPEAVKSTHKRSALDSSSAAALGPATTPSAPTLTPSKATKARTVSLLQCSKPEMRGACRTSSPARNAKVPDPSAIATMMYVASSRRRPSSSSSSKGAKSPVWCRLPSSSAASATRRQAWSPSKRSPIGLRSGDGSASVSPPPSARCVRIAGGRMCTGSAPAYVGDAPMYVGEAMPYVGDAPTPGARDSGDVPCSGGGRKP
mmetsp:Transcript_16400/g.58243  ORF Transcript_16400/g.58243 Transcript_16400/m.58243 type:complete len:201 (+) Transcript_16400:571-1173(+)